MPPVTIRVNVFKNLQHGSTIERYGRTYKFDSHFRKYFLQTTAVERERNRVEFDKLLKQHNIKHELDANEEVVDVVYDEWLGEYVSS